MMADLGFENILLAAIKQGVSLVQLREKTLNTYDFINFAKKIKTLVTKYSIPLIINDRVDVALACDADGVHLGQEDMNIDDARILLGPHKIIGVTIENKYQFYNLSNKKISYFGVSSIYPTTTKSNVANIWSDDDIKEIKKQSQIPLIGIGGIGTGNIKKTLNKKSV